MVIHKAMEFIYRLKWRALLFDEKINSKTSNCGNKFNYEMEINLYNLSSNRNPSYNMYLAKLQNYLMYLITNMDSQITKYFTEPLVREKFRN